MKTKVATIGIIVENTNSVNKLNDLLHDYGTYIIGRMGIPYKERNINVISIVVDAPEKTTGELSDKLSMLDGVSAKTVYAKYDV